MNRQQRRAMKKNNAEPVYTVKPSDLTGIKEKATKDAVDTAICLLLSIPIKVMHDNYGWGMKKRLPELAEAIIDEYQRFSDGDMTLQEYQDMVFKYCGVKFKKTED